jgi:hypothetical protein
MDQAQAVADLRGIDVMMPPACLLWQLAIQISWIQITRITQITPNIITITEATPTTIPVMTAVVIAGVGIAGTVAEGTSVEEIRVAAVDVIRAMRCNKRKRASLILLQECPFYVYCPFNTSRIFPCV